MNEPDIPESTPEGPPHADALVDALLAQMAASGGGDDETFLARAEAAIDSEMEEAKILRPRFRRLAVAALAAAAAVVVGLGAWLLSRSTGEDASPLMAGGPAETVPGGQAEVADGTAATEAEPSDDAQAGHSTPPTFVTTDQPVVPDPAAEAAQTKYILLLQENVKKADEFALRGSQLMAEGDYQGGIDQYRAALDLLPDAPMTEPRHRAYTRQFSRASVLLATQRAEEGRYPEAIALVEDVLQPSVDLDNIDAKRLLERLNDPDYYSPALTPSHLERVRRVKLALQVAQGYVDLGDYDRANREFNQVLNNDPYSMAARRGMEDNERHKLNYYDTAYDHTRARMLREVAKGWETPVPSGERQFASGKLEALSPISRIPIESSTARYAPIADGSWASPSKSPLSTFSIDVDTASWTNLRGMVRSGLGRSAIPKDAVRIEELVNYFPWNYPQPEGEHPFAFATEVGPCPWNDRHRLLRVGIQGKAMPQSQRPAANLVFLVDVSGSMGQSEKLPLVTRSISLFARTMLDERDRIAIVTYAGSEGVALPPTSGRDTRAILDALPQLKAGGSTNGGAGIRKAYELAGENYIESGINRVILCTDGDFNVGVTGTEELVALVKEKAQGDIYLSVFGFGRDNLNDAMLEEITNRGNGNYFYIDSYVEAVKVFLDDLMGTLVTIAKDVKIQVEFNPAQVFQYRLIGYANRRLENEDFANDEVDAGEVGSGHAVTALYEIVPKGDPAASAEAGELRYQKTEAATQPVAAPSDELAFVKLRYKRLDEERSLLMEQPIAMGATKAGDATDDFRFASAVALFGMILREQQGTGGETLQQVVDLATSAKGPDPEGHRAEFIDVVRQLMAAGK